MDVLFTPPAELDTNPLNLRAAFLINQRNLAALAAWAHTEVDIVRIFASSVSEIDKRRATIRRLMRNMNREETRAVMHVLAWQPLNQDGKSPTEYSLYKLASILDHSRVDSIIKTLRSIVLPTLITAGYVGGLEQREEYSREGHRIRLTRKGLKAQQQYLTRCAAYCRPIDDELAELSSYRNDSGTTALESKHGKR